MLRLVRSSREGIGAEAQTCKKQKIIWSTFTKGGHESIIDVDGSTPSSAAVGGRGHREQEGKVHRDTMTSAEMVQASIVKCLTNVSSNSILR
jgi:hypothetical protein